jgi:hypothetical protein
MRLLPPLLTFLVFSAGAGLRNAMTAKRRGSDPGPSLLETTIVVLLVVGAALEGDHFRGDWSSTALALVAVALLGVVLRVGLGKTQAASGGSGDFDLPMSEPANGGLKLWHRIKPVLMEIGAFESGIVLTLFYFAVMLPFGLLVRATQDPLQLRLPAADSFWHKRKREEASLEAARRQFD